MVYGLKWQLLYDMRQSIAKRNHVSKQPTWLKCVVSHNEGSPCSLKNKPKREFPKKAALPPPPPPHSGSFLRPVA